MNVVAIGTAEPVMLQAHGTNHTSGNGFLAVVKMDKAKHFAAVIHFSTFIFKAPAQGHVAIKQQALIAAHAGRLERHQAFDPCGMESSLVGRRRGGNHLKRHLGLGRQGSSEFLAHDNRTRHRCGRLYGVRHATTVKTAATDYSHGSGTPLGWICPLTISVCSVLARRPMPRRCYAPFSFGSIALLPRPIQRKRFRPERTCCAPVPKCSATATVAPPTKPLSRPWERGVNP